MPRESKAAYAQRMRLQSEYIVKTEKALEAQRVKNMATINAKIRATHKSGFNVEFDMIEVTAEAVDRVIAEMLNLGYTPTTNRSGANASAVDNNGKLATVKEITKIDGKNQWQVIATIDGVGNGEQKFLVFTEGAFIVGDRIRLTRNEKGYYGGTRAIGAPKSADDIPF